MKYVINLKKGLKMSFEITKLLMIFLSILVLLIKKVNLGLNLILNSLLVGLLFNVKFLEIFYLWRKVAFNIETVELLGIIFLVYMLNIILENIITLRA